MMKLLLFSLSALLLLVSVTYKFPRKSPYIQSQTKFKLDNCDDQYDLCHGWQLNVVNPGNTDVAITVSCIHDGNETDEFWLMVAAHNSKETKVELDEDLALSPCYISDWKLWKPKIK